MWYFHFQYHNGNDDGYNTIAKSLEPSFAHNKSFCWYELKPIERIIRIVFDVQHQCSDVKDACSHVLHPSFDSVDGCFEVKLECLCVKHGKLNVKGACFDVEVTSQQFEDAILHLQIEKGYAIHENLKAD
jgi:hypothetical protein